MAGTPCTLHPSTYTLHPAPYTLQPTPYTLHPTPCTLHPAPYTLHPTPSTLHPKPCTHEVSSWSAVCWSELVVGYYSRGCHARRPSLLLSLSMSFRGPWRGIFCLVDYFPSEAQAFYTCHDVVCFYNTPDLFGRLLGVSSGSACNLKLKRCVLNV